MGIVRAVHCCRGGKHQFPAAELLHHFYKGQRCVQVIAIVLQGLLDTLAHSLKAGKVDHGVNIIIMEDFPELFFVCAVHPVEGDTLSGDLLNAVNDFNLGVGQVIHNDNLMSCIQQFHSGMAADISGTACN